MGEVDLDDPRPFEFPNEGKVEFDPRFVCESCGFANVKLEVVNDTAAARCTSCGQGYLETNGAAATEADDAEDS